jgi:3-phytase
MNAAKIKGIAAAALLLGVFASACGDGESEPGDADDDGSAGSTSTDQGGAGGDDGPAGLDEGDGPPKPEGLAVTAVIETEAVDSFGDAADDPAIWVHPDDPEKSLVLGSDKTVGGGLYAFELDGSVHQFVENGEINNIDLRQGFSLGGEEVTLVTGTKRTDHTLVVYALDTESRTLVDVAARPIVTAEDNYGLCMYRSPEGEFYSIVTTELGRVEQYRLFESEGKVDAELVREFCLPSQPEGCVADDELGNLFVGEEAIGVWKFAAEPDGEAPGDQTPDCEGAMPGILVDGTIDGALTRDVEGMAIAKTGPEAGYLIVSAQGAHEYVMYERQAPHAHVKSFSIWGGGPSCLDGTEETDGLDVTTADLGPKFPGGLFVAQDGSNNDPVDTQNFKFVSFSDVIEERYEENLDCDVSDYGGKANASEEPPGPERTPEFCETFCGRCDECYEEGDPNFAEGDCHYRMPKPEFDLDDCLEGCNAGFIPGTTAPLQPGWETRECVALDDSL